MKNKLSYRWSRRNVLRTIDVVARLFVWSALLVLIATVVALIPQMIREFNWEWAYLFACALSLSWIFTRS